MDTLSSNKYFGLLESIALQNKYTKWYVQLCQRAFGRALSGYTETHHIIPRSLKLGGLKDPCNLVALTAREHYIAHLLLTKMFDGQRRYKMLAAAFMMANRTRMCGGRLYGVLREKYAKELSERTKGKPLSSEVLATRFGRFHNHEATAHPVHSSIDVEATVARFGYDPRTLKLKSNRMVVKVCGCGDVKDAMFYQANQGQTCKVCRSKKNLEIMQSAEGREANAERMRQRWADASFREHTSKAVAKANSERATRRTQ